MAYFPDFDKSGFYLQKASSNLKASLIFGAASAGLVLVNNSKSGDEDYDPDNLNILAGVSAIVGLGFSIAAIYNIGKAGDFLRSKKKIVLKSSGDGLGLAFKF